MTATTEKNLSICPKPPAEAGKARFSRVGCVFLLIIHGILLFCSARANSVTFDEYAHLPAGVAYWRFGWDAFPLYNLSPPLLRLIAAAPVMVAGVDAPPVTPVFKRAPRDRHWVYAEQFETANATRYQHLFVLARMALIPISCLGLWIVWKWAGELYGPIAALAAATMWAFEPDLLAQGSVVGTDAGTAVAILAASWLWWKFCAGGKTRWMIFAALAVAAAMLCKFTAAILPGIMLAIAMVRMTDRSIARSISGRRVLVGFAVTFAGVWLIINATYGFRGTMRANHRYGFVSTQMNAIQRILPDDLPLLLPRTFIEGFDVQMSELATGLEGFLMGQEYRGTRWDYYPIALGVKLPVGAIALIGLAVASLFVAKPKPPELAVMAALLVAVVSVAGFGKVNLGVRYVLSTYPLAIVLIARIWKTDIWRGRFAAIVAPLRTALLMMMVVECLWVAPRFISFINFAAGGKERGWRIVNDSNFDWGQGLIDLHDWLAARGNPPICLAYFGRVNPATYGIDFSPITSPRGEKYVGVSTYFLDGLEHRLATGHGPSDFVHLPYAAQLRSRQPIGRAGATIFIYRSIDVAAAAREAKAAAKNDETGISR